MAHAPSYEDSMKTGRHGMWNNTIDRISTNTADWQSAERYLDRFFNKSFFSRLSDNIEVALAVVKKAKSIGENKVATNQRKKALAEASTAVKQFRKKKKRHNFKSSQEETRERVAAYTSYAYAMNEIEGYFGNWIFAT